MPIVDCRLYCLAHIYLDLTREKRTTWQISENLHFTYDNVMKERRGMVLRLCILCNVSTQGNRFTFYILFRT